MYVLVTKNNKNLTINVYLFSYKNMLKLYFNKHLIYIKDMFKVIFLFIAEKIKLLAITKDF